MKYPSAMPDHDLALQLDGQPLGQTVRVRLEADRVIAVDDSDRRWSLDTGRPNRGGPWADFPRSAPALRDAHQSRLTQLTRSGGRGPVDWELAQQLLAEGLDDDAIARATGATTQSVTAWRARR